MMHRTGSEDRSLRKIVAVILAAGASSRYGSPKQLCRLQTKDNKTLLQLAIESVNVLEVQSTCVVLGCNLELIAPHLGENPQIVVRENKAWKEGISTSIREAALYAIDEQASHLLLLACDQPLVSSQLIQNMIARLGQTEMDETSTQADPDIVCCRYGTTVGIPALFYSIFFEALMQLAGDKGAKALILQNPSTAFIDFQDAAIDIDRLEDMEKLNTA